MKIQLTLDQIERILAAAKNAQKRDDSLSDTVEIEVTSKASTHLGGDWVGAAVKSGYAECNSTSIFWNK